MNITDRAMSSQILNGFTDSGAKAPKAFTDAHERATRIAAAVRNLGAGQGDLAQAVMQALDAGRDPATDADVQRIAVAAQIANPGIEQQIDAMAFDGFREACTAHTDAIIAAWRKPFDVAAAALTEAHARIGDVPLEDTGTIMRKGADVAEVWAKATAAVKVIDAVDAAWQALGTISGSSSSDRRYRVLRIAAVDFETWVEREYEGMRLSPWAAIGAGLTLSLPTMTEYRGRVAVITAGAEQVAAEQEDDRRAYLTGRRPTDRTPIG